MLVTEPDSSASTPWTHTAGDTFTTANYLLTSTHTHCVLLFYRTDTNKGKQKIEKYLESIIIRTTSLGSTCMESTTQGWKIFEKKICAKYVQISLVILLKRSVICCVLVQYVHHLVLNHLQVFQSTQKCVHWFFE